MNLGFTPTGQEDFTSWADRDRTTYRKVPALLKEVLRTPVEGTGKPEPLMYQLGNIWSRRITQERRLVYAVESDQIVVFAARFHYGD